MARLVVQAAFKRTEIGSLPKDWRAATLGEIATVAAGSTPSRKVMAYWGGDIPWVTTAQIDFNTVLEANESITELGLKNSAAKLLRPSTLLLALYGQGKTRGKVAILGIAATTNQACASIVVSDAFARAYVFHYLASQYDAIRQLSNSGSQDNLNGQLVRSIRVPIPPSKAEQEAIAEALSDADTLIESLEQLLAKKRQIKQGAMQELLTGQRRLPGFSVLWSEGRVGTVVTDLVAGVSVNSDTQGSESSVLAVLKTSALGRGNFYPEESKPITRADLGRVRTSPRRDSILVSRMNTPDLVGDVAYVSADYPSLFLPDRIWMTQVASDSDVNMRWLAYVLASREYRRRIGDAATGTSGSMKNLSKGALLGLPVRFPSAEEQTAIAATLSDMDAELTALEARVAKTRLLKQGMAQALLTGRIRLV